MWYGSRRPAPRQVAPVPAIPVEQPAPEGAACRGSASRRHRDWKRAPIRAAGVPVAASFACFEPSIICQRRENLHQDRRQRRDRPVRRHARRQIGRARRDLRRRRRAQRLARSGPRRAVGAGDCDVRPCSNRSSAISSRSARGWPIRAHRIAERVTKAAIDRRGHHAARAVDRRARSDTAAAAPLHPGRRIARRRGAPRGPHDLPPRRARHGGAPAARTNRPSSRAPHLHQPAVGSALRHGAIAPTARPEFRNSSGEPRTSRPPTAPASGGRDRTMKTFPSPRGCCRRRCVRTSPPCMPSPGSPTILPTKGSSRRRAAGRAR